MRLEIRRRGVTVTEDLGARLRARLRLTLGRFARHINRVRVYLRDVNGPRGGMSKKCRIVVELPPRGRVVVTGAETDISAAISGTASRAELAVKRYVKRRRARRRRTRAPRSGKSSPVNKGVESLKNRSIMMSDADHQCLESLIESARYNASLRQDDLGALERELERAQVVPQLEVPPEVITMNSVVRLRDLGSDETEKYELVYPADADMTHNRISILAPIGTAILGYRLGDVIEWPVPAGLRRLRVEEVLYQPEKVGAL